MNKLNYKHTKTACFIGFVVQAVINNFLPILFIIFQKNYSVSYEKLGRLIFVNFFTQLFADLLTPYITKIAGYRKTVVISHILASVGFCLLTFLPIIFKGYEYSCIIISVIIYAFGSGIIEVVVSPIVQLIPGENKTADMVLTHSFYCWGQAFTIIVTTLLVALLGYSRWNYIPLIWAVVPILNMFFFLCVPIIEPEKSENTKTKLELFKTRRFWCFAVFMLCSGATEIAMSEWASVFAQQSLGLDKTIGDILGPSFFALFMGLGRIVFAGLSKRVSIRKVLIVNNILCALCYFAVGFFNMPVFSIIACALCGFGVSVSWPGTYSLAAANFPSGGTLMFSIFALCGDMGCSVGPWILGIVADKFGLKSGFLALTFFPIVMLLTALFVLKEKDCINH